MSLKWLAAVAVAVLAACGPRMPAMDAGAGSPDGLGSSMNVRVVADTVLLEIHVTNVTDGPISLEFMTTQRYDFEISTTSGEGMWRWSADRSFGEALGREALQPGESLRFSAAWSSAGREGDYVATGWIVSSNYPVELRTGFRLPAE